jgi:pimeloyl-ACP methyl ester carboxylesterase
VKFEKILSASGELAATRTGAGEPLIVLVHGWTCRRSHWAGVLHMLGAYGEVLAVDLPGHGDSACSPPATATVAGLAQELAKIIEQQGTRPVILVGHSMGGAVALEAARLLNQAHAVILVDTFVIPYGDLPEEQAQEIEQAFAADFVGAMQGLVDGNTNEGMPASLKAQLHHDMASADPAWALPLWGDLLRWQPDAALSQSGVAIHAINGGLIPEPARQRCAGHVIEKVIAEAKHFPQLETPEKFEQLLEQTIKGLL